MLAARGPFGLCSTSYCTLSFSFSVLKPLAWMDEKCTKRSLLPSSGVMKPKPLASLNHFTVPVLMSVSLKSIRRRAQSEESRPCGKSRREPTDEDSTNRYDPTSYSLLENPTVPLYRYSSAQSNLARARPGHALAAAADRADALVDELLQALALVGLGRVEVAFRVGGDAVHAVGAPVALHPAGVGVEHGDALVLVAVGDERLVGLRVDEDLRRAAEVLEVVAALVVAVLAHLQQELAVLGELQHLRVLCAVAADPDVALVVDEDAVVRLRPLVARSRAAPVPHQVAGLVEHQHRRRAAAALAGRRIELQALLVVVVRGRAAVDDPDVVLLVDPDADRHAEQPVVGQGLGPQWIDFEHRRLHDLRLVGLTVEERLRAAEHRE